MTDLPEVSIVAAYVHPGSVRAEFCGSLLDMVTKSPVPFETVLSYQSGPNISTARNLIVREFLDNWRSAWLLMVDTDMVFAPDAAARLLDAASPDKRPIVGALCFSDEGGKPLPTMYDLAENDDGVLAFSRPAHWAPNAVRKVSATGAAFLLMHRSALQKIEANSGDQAAPWFRESAVGAPLSLMGEDLTFCLRAGAAGLPVFVNTAVQVGHMKPVMLGKVT